MKKYGLIGFPLAHSFSINYFTKKFIASGITSHFIYENFELADLSEFNKLLIEHKEIFGLNVTIPYKEKIIPFLDELVGVANEIRAVNTIRILRNEDGEVLKKSGFNTDVTGFDKAISPFLKPIHKGAMILGTGGASLAVSYVFTQKKIPFVFVSRSKNENTILYSQISKQLLHDYPVIVNTTPLGTYPDIDSLPPLPYELLNTDNILFDLVYNPAKTKFMQMGEQAGATISNGYEMLVAQAEAAWEIWNS